MTMRFDNGVVRLYQGNARDMAFLGDHSVDCVVTSPPYWGLRDFGLGPVVWDGKEGCEHEWDNPLISRETRSDQFKSWANHARDHLPPVEAAHVSRSQGAFCVLCEAWCGTLGLEPPPQLYVQHLVQIFREIWRVLKPWGTVWLNLGDSYASNWPSPNRRNIIGNPQSAGKRHDRPPHIGPGLKDKDLVGIPWRVAFALQEEGWWLRSDIVWAKANPMPESVRDRPTQSHEYIFLLTKAKRYYYDQSAIREPQTGNAHARRKDGIIENTNGKTNPAVRGTHAGWRDHYLEVLGGRARRSVWHIAVQPYSGAHFATFPEKLVEPCILAGTSEKGNCPDCGKPWERIVEKEVIPHAGETGTTYAERTNANRLAMVRKAGRQRGNDHDNPFPVAQTIGWRPTCTCANPGFAPDDWELIASPRGKRNGQDPSLVTGRAGYNRPRGDDKGTRLMTRYEQRHYAAQLRVSPYKDAMKHEAGSAFAHYVRTDRSGARPIPPALLRSWLDCGWLAAVATPAFVEPAPPIPAVALDPFAGSGTVGVVAQRLRRHAVLVEASEAYCVLAAERIKAEPLPLVAVPENGGA